MPELSGGSGWLNTDRPLRIHDELKGRVVVLDFWTYCCINCLQTFPALKQLEAKFAGKPFQVVGVHSAKFEDEKDAQHIQSAMERSGISHPVLVDSDFAVWKRFDVAGWPTIVLIDSDGNRVAQQSGEPDADKLEQQVARLIEEGRERGTLANGPPKFERPKHEDTGPLAFPGKVTALDGDRVAIADSGHHRIIVAKTDGTLIAQVGSGLEGFSDGDFGKASFRRPQGIAGRGAILYVADTENHAIRRIDLDAKTVKTVAGTGQKGDPSLRTDVDPLHESLRSPWDLAWVKDNLYIAMAGSHQLWRLDLKKNTVSWFVGSGEENRKDGPAAQAQLAQPSGLWAEGPWLYFADSEDSSLRRARLADGEVETLVGAGLFDFGSIDGPAASARFQHPLGVAVMGETAYVADTFNNQLRSVDLKHKIVASVTPHESAPLLEPGGLTVVGKRLLISDTNHHRLVWIDPKSPTPVLFEIKGLRAPSVQGIAETPLPTADGLVPSVLGNGTLVRGDTELTLQLAIPKGYELNEEAPQKVKLELSGVQGVTRGVEKPLEKSPALLTSRIPLKVAPNAAGTLIFDVNVYFCEAVKKSECLLDRRRLLYRVDGSSPDAKAPVLTYAVQVMEH